MFILILICRRFADIITFFGELINDSGLIGEFSYNCATKGEIYGKLKSEVHNKSSILDFNKLASTTTLHHK